MCLTSERTSSQLQKLEHNTSHTASSEQAEVKYVSSKGDKTYKPRGKHPFKGQGKKQQKTVQPKNSAMVIKCKYCGGTHPRDRDKCPAFGHTCWKCKKKNHFPKVCKQTTVNSIQDEDTSDSDSDSLYAVNSSSGKQWFVKIHMSASGNSSNVTCQLDSGSTCNVINFRQYAKIMQTGDPPLKPTEKTLKLYGGKSKLIPLGIATLKCRVIQSGKTENLDFYVVEMDQTPILSAEACEKLGLLTVNVVHKLTTTSSQFKPMSKEQILDEFKDVFEGLAAALLEPNISTNTHEKIMRKRQLSKQQYDKHTKDLPELQIGQNVRMKKHPNDKYWQFGTCTQSLGNRSYLIDLNGKSYRRNRREMRPTKEAHDAERTDPLPYKPEDDPLMITNEPPQYESVKQPIAPEPQTAFGSSRATITSPASDNNCAVNASTKLRGSSRIARLPSKFKDFIMN
uniref:Uncharacterized protein n=1 Tax=Magallana gigas TaxID=29159 RepID=A0A8W8N379_MAGGI